MTEPTPHVAAGDCERCRRGVIAQPVNTASSLALVVAGWFVLDSVRRRGTDEPAEAAVGWSAVAAGLGSVAYHGPGTAVGRYVHDASLIALVASVAVADASVVTGREPSRASLMWLLPASGLAALPAVSGIAQPVVGAAAVVAEGWRARARPAGRRRRAARAAQATVAGLGAMAHTLGRTGGPLCNPDSVVQPHALWHTAMAASLFLRTASQAAPGRT